MRQWQYAVGHSAQLRDEHLEATSGIRERQRTEQAERKETELRKVEDDMDRAENEREINIASGAGEAKKRKGEEHVEKRAAEERTTGKQQDAIRGAEQEERNNSIGPGVRAGTQ